MTALKKYVIKCESGTVVLFLVSQLKKIKLNVLINVPMWREFVFNSCLVIKLVKTVLGSYLNA